MQDRLQLFGERTSRDTLDSKNSTKKIAQVGETDYNLDHFD